MEEHKAGKDSFNIKREVDSLDDFEHLGHDSSPLQDLLGLQPDKEVTAPGTVHEIDITPKTAVSHHTGSSEFTSNPVKMNQNLLEDDFLGRGEGSEKLDSFLQDPTLKPSPVFDNDHSKQSSFNLIEAERVSEPAKKHIDQFLDFEDHHDMSHPKGDFKSDVFEDVMKTETFTPEKPLIPDVSSEIPHIPVEQPPILEKVSPPAVPDKKPEPLPEKKPEPLPERKPEPIPEKKPEPVQEKKTESKKLEEKKSTTVTPAKIAPPDAAALFCKMGLVESLIYWRDPKKSGPVFGGVLVVLLALTYFSLISVVAYLSLIGLSVTVAFRIYKNIVQAVQKTGDGHPFKDFLELDVSLPQEKVKEITEVAVAHVNAAVVELRRLFLVEDLVDSIKFGVLLWTLTYVGAWFNGMTLIILSWVALFTLPKVYEANKTQIDANMEIVRTKLAEITSKIKAAIPMGKKAEEKKEQ